jgi:hypothetical protein
VGGANVLPVIRWFHVIAPLIAESYSLTIFLSSRSWDMSAVDEPLSVDLITLTRCVSRPDRQGLTVFMER